MCMPASHRKIQLNATFVNRNVSFFKNDCNGSGCRCFWTLQQRARQYYKRGNDILFLFIYLSN